MAFFCTGRNAEVTLQMLKAVKLLVCETRAAASTKTWSFTSNFMDPVTWMERRCAITALLHSATCESFFSLECRQWPVVNKSWAQKRPGRCLLRIAFRVTLSLQMLCASSISNISSIVFDMKGNQSQNASLSSALQFAWTSAAELAHTWVALHARIVYFHFHKWTLNTNRKTLFVSFGTSVQLRRIVLLEMSCLSIWKLDLNSLT